MNYIQKRERHVRIDLVKDLIRLDLLTCKPISQQRDTRPLAARTTRPLRIANSETRPMQTEVDR